MPVWEGWLAVAQLPECESSAGEISGNDSCFKSVFSFRKDYIRMWLYKQVGKREVRAKFHLLNFGCYGTLKFSKLNQDERIKH